MNKIVEHVVSLIEKAAKAPNAGDAAVYAEAAKSAAEATAVLSRVAPLGSLPK